jgi:glycosyltransferase involved in cell wall biosynthesis
MAPAARVAYITTHYPALSHTFIQREVAALRRSGVEVHTISMRRTAGEHLLSSEHRDAARTTYAIRPARWGHVLSTHLGALCRHPRGYLATLRTALGLAPARTLGRLWQVFYFGEAILVWRYCAERAVAHVHSHHGSAPADVALLAAHFGNASSCGPRTWSLTVHGPIELSDVSWFGLAEKARRADAVVCISDFARSQLMALTDAREWPKLRVVRCGLSLDEYEHCGTPAGGRPRVLCVGRLVQEKGHAVLLQATAQLAREGHELEVALVGSGPLRDQLEGLARRLGIGDRVDFAGALGYEQVRQRYAMATLFCSPSFAEGLPVVLMEAMASGRAVIATAIAGVRELVHDEQTGLLVTPGRPDELAAAIARLLEDPDLRKRLSRAGRRRVASEFDVDRSAQLLRELFSGLSSGDGPAAAQRFASGALPASYAITQDARPLEDPVVAATPERSHEMLASRT